jgi:membrane-bound lytic murein transglycosylase B
MKLRRLMAAAAVVCLVTTSAASAQEPGRNIISIYHVAPGHQLEFLRWIAQQDRVSAAAGLPRGQFYAHTDGDSWDYLAINALTTPEQDAAFDAAGKRMGVNTVRGGFEMRKHITSHTDTITRGPMSAAEDLALMGEK